MNDNQERNLQETPAGEPIVQQEESISLAKKPEPKPVPKKKYKSKKSQRKGCATALVWVLCIVVVSVGLATGLLLMIADFLGVGKSGTVQIEIEKGASSASIARTLDEAGAIRYSTLFRVYSKLMGFDGTYKYGVYIVNKENGYESIARMLQEEGAKAETVKVTIPEMADIDEIRTRFVEAGICDAQQFREAMSDLSYYEEFDFIEKIPVEQVYYNLEGYLFPETYEFYKYGSTECARQAIKKCLAQTEEQLKPYLDEIADSGYTVHEVLTMASIVEMEASAASQEDRQKVAAVFYNRLDWKDQPKLLGSSPTMEYPYGNGRYDTNKTEGLPPGPLCCPSAASIKAAVYPEKDFDYHYFVTDKNMKFYYNKTLKQHNSTINDLKRKKLWA
ncbi:MAG: endolytic transglycosylase MltG [Clostridia bacterium]|nr:endolytic transglycosylase MltG [Clostridia bacterium]